MANPVVDPVREEVVAPAGGGLMLLVLLLTLGLSVWGVIAGALAESPFRVIGFLLLILVSFVSLFGLIVVEPNESKVLLLFGKYKGTVKRDGWYWVNPFYSKKKVSLRIVNFETDRMKVNDMDGNPIEIAAIVVWRVVDTAEASFSVEDYHDYVEVQSEAAVRNMATQYHYDSHDEGGISLRGHTQVIAEKLRDEIHARLDRAGVEVIEARLSHLAYAQEIAEAMLRRQQAGAIIAARQKIVDGAVGMVEMALAQLEKGKVVSLDADQKAAMVSNLLVVLCSDHSATPVLNTGTLSAG
jgi:regulator of protease activity HflC (stomatin/prohibitin superfamily)